MADPATKPDPLAKRTYVLQRSSWIGPHLKQKDDEVEMTEAEAQYYVPHVLKLKADVEKDKAPEAKVVGSLDDPNVKGSGAAETEKAANRKRSSK